MGVYLGPHETERTCVTPETTGRSRVTHLGDVLDERDAHLDEGQPDEQVDPGQQRARRAHKAHTERAERRKGGCRCARVPHGRRKLLGPALVDQALTESDTCAGVASNIFL